MKTTSSEKYLGEIISNTGNIDENIQARINKGNGTVNTIISLLEEISFGNHYFEMALLFRNSMLINSLLSSSEVLYGIKNKHIEILEKCDRDLLIRLFSVPFTCSYEAVYLEIGCSPIRFILQGRRLLYYWTLLNKPEDELVKRGSRVNLEVFHQSLLLFKGDKCRTSFSLDRYFVKPIYFGAWTLDSPSTGPAK